MRIYRWKKPVLTVTLTSGGTLLPNTQYWIMGNFRSYSALGGGYNAFYNGSGPHSDPVTFTTDAIYQSISVAWKTSGAVTSIADAGGGEVLVTSALHCLRSNDTITIMSGAYAGTYNITWVSYDTFKITATWGATDTPNWECYMLPNGCESIALWMHTVYPINADGTLNGTGTVNQYLSHGYNYTAYTTNPIVVTAPFALVRQNESDPFFSQFGPSFSDAFETGMPIIVGTETSLTLNQLNDEFVAAGLAPGCRAGFVKGSYGIISYYGYLDLKNVTTDYRYVGVNCLYGTFRMDAATFRDSSFTFNYPIFRAWCGFKAYNTMLGGGYGQQFDIIPTDATATSFNPKQLNYQIFMNTAAGSIDNGCFCNVATVNVAYPKDATITNTKFYGPYLYWVMANNGVYPPVGFRSMSNVEIKYAYNAYDMVIYTYSVGYDYVQNFENIDTDRAKNLKIFVMNTNNSDIDVVCWRKGSFYLNDDIDGASVTIVAGTETYNYTSVNGKVDFDIIEQLSYPRYNMIANDNIIEDIVVTVSKEGFQTYPFIVPLARDLVDMYVKLSPNPQPITFSIRRLLSRIFASGKTLSSTELLTEGTQEVEASAPAGEVEILTNDRATYRPATGDILFEREIEDDVWEDVEVIAEDAELVRGSASVVDDPAPVYIDRRIKAEILTDEIKAEILTEEIKA